MDTEKTGLKNDVARLERAGSEYSGWIKKLRQSVNELAEFLDRTYGSLCGAKIQLPGSFTFQSWPSGEYRFIGYVSGYDGAIEILLEHQEKSRESLLKFAGVVAEGWLNEVATHIEKQAGKLREATESIERFTAAK